MFVCSIVSELPFYGCFHPCIIQISLLGGRSCSTHKENSLKFCIDIFTENHSTVFPAVSEILGFIQIEGHTDRQTDIVKRCQTL